MSAQQSAPPRGFRPRFASLLLGFMFLGLLHAPLSALPPEPGVQVRDAWVRWLPGGLPAAGYLTLVNSSAAPLELTAASSPDYAEVRLHESYTTHTGAARMRQLDKLRVAAGGQIHLAPGGYHLMLMKPTRTIEVGGAVTITLTFGDGRSVQVRAPVKPASFGG